MRLKTYLAAYMLFLCILFASVGIVSAHLANSTVDMLRDKSAREFESISDSLARDIAAVYSRFAAGEDFNTAVAQVFDGYVLFYRRNNIRLDLTYTHYVNASRDATIVFVRENGEHFVSIIGVLPYPFGFYQLSYTLDITASIAGMQQTQRVLWVVSVAVSLVAAVFLYLILLKIFRPLEIVAHASWLIADGQYSERIAIKGKNELASMATAFNRMATQIESQISMLEDEALKKQQFVDNFAHEIRTPLTSIYGYAEYLQKAKLDEDELIESAGYIMLEADHMKSVANSLLELATLRNYQPNILPIYLPELFEDINKSLDILLAEREARLHCQSFAYSLPGQQDLIKTLLLNLCKNAIQACDVGKGEIFMVSDKEDGKVILTVADNGCGIPQDKLDKVAEPFFRIDKSRSRDNGGVGLGLALCKQIADVHNAKMVIDSKLSSGTTVKIIFELLKHK